MAPRPLSHSSNPLVQPVLAVVHTCGITFSPVKRGSRDIIDTLKYQCDCAPRAVSMGEYVASPRVASGTIQMFPKESDYLLPEPSYAIDVHKTEPKEQHQQQRQQQHQQQQLNGPPSPSTTNTTASSTKGAPDRLPSMAGPSMTNGTRSSSQLMKASRTSETTS